MGLAQSQTLLARLVTDALLRARFARDMHAVGAEFGLSRAEVDQLALIPSRQVARFAASLQNKRQLEVMKLLPLSHLVLKEIAFARLFDRHASSFVPAGVHKHRDDALTFARRAEQWVLAGEASPDWAADALRYEAARLSATDTARWCTLRWLRHSVSDMARCAQSRQGAPPIRSTLALWLRFGTSGRVRHFVLTRPEPLRSTRAASILPHSLTIRADDLAVRSGAQGPPGA